MKKHILGTQTNCFEVTLCVRVTLKVDYSPKVV